MLYASLSLSTLCSMHLSLSLRYADPVKLDISVDDNMSELGRRREKAAWSPCSTDNHTPRHPLHTAATTTAVKTASLRLTYTALYHQVIPVRMTPAGYVVCMYVCMYVCVHSYIQAILKSIFRTRAKNTHNVCLSVYTSYCLSPSFRRTLTVI